MGDVSDPSIDKEENAASESLENRPDNIRTEPTLLPPVRIVVSRTERESDITASDAVEMPLPRQARVRTEKLDPILTSPVTDRAPAVIVSEPKTAALDIDSTDE
jgi:hypothetical protein